jgi:lysophospholipase L1-like esterase
MARYLRTDSGEPRDDLFRTDKLHLNEEGYRVWTSVLGPVLTRLLWKPAAARVAG